VDAWRLADGGLDAGWSDAVAVAAPRPSGGGCDTGAGELTPASGLMLVGLALVSRLRRRGRPR
jgi:uncharacterized protein (TIGR03382 family)